MTEKGLKVNVNKVKAFCNGEKTVAMETSRFLSSVCRRDVGSTPLYVRNATVMKMTHQAVNFVSENVLVSMIVLRNMEMQH